MLEQFKKNTGETYQFVDPATHRRNGDNNFTVVVGRNGTGKSRLLRDVVTYLIEGVADSDSLLAEERANLREAQRHSLKIERPPSRIICVSTSPFDRFPLLRREYVGDGYSYLGVRGLTGSNFGLSYMSRFISTLIATIAQNPKQAHSVASVLQYLKYDGVIRANFSLPGKYYLNGLLQGDPNRFVFNHFAKTIQPHSDISAALRRIRFDPGRLQAVVRALENTARALKKIGLTKLGRIDVSIGDSGISIHSKAPHDDIIELASAGLLILHEVTLNKHRASPPLKLHEASSGEQSVVVGLLGIGSRIKDNALICIDEPETCLHPAWQEQYIRLLFHTFREYKYCHFAIATHSPQIVAQLPEGNCYILTMEDGIARNARSFSRRSIDFQLAEVFNAPGYRNEYLSRIALNLFARVSREKRFDERGRVEMKALRKALDQMDDQDPLRELISALDELVLAYA